MHLSDLSQLAQSNQLDSLDFELSHPTTGDNLGVTLTVVSGKSKQAMAQLSKMMRKEQKRELENAHARKPKFKELSEMQAESRELALSRLIGWKNVQWQGKPLEFTPENAEMLLTECDWIIEQILEQSNDFAKFLKA